MIILTKKTETKTFKITKVRFKGDDGKFFIYAVKDTETDEYASLKGNMPEFSVGMVVECYYNLEVHPTFGKQYTPTSFIERAPQTTQEKRALMNLFLTPGQVQSFLDVYKEPFDIIKEVEDGNLRWEEVKGFGKKNFETLSRKITGRRGGALLSAKLAHFGVTSNMGEKLFKKFQTVENALKQINDNPYLLCNFKGLGFKTIDPIALEMNIEPESVHRIRAAARFVTKQNELSGSTYMTYKSFVDEMFDLLNISVSRIAEVNLGEDIHIDDKLGTVAFNDTYKREIYSANFVRDILDSTVAPFPLGDKDVEEFISTFESENGVSFTDEQKSFFYAVKDNYMVCLLGYAGTGKSMLQKALVQLVEKARWDICLTAPTGRASKLLQDYTGRDASTIHSRLGIGVKKEKSEYGEDYDEDKRVLSDKKKNPYLITENVFVADEFSMTDTEIMYHIAQNKGSARRFVFIGDPEQLPSVGAGKVLLDLTQNGIKTVELTRVFRQEEGGILDLATRARNKEKLVKEENGMKRIGKDTIFHQTLKEKIPAGIIHYMKLLMKRMDLSDITVISPTNKGEIGVQALNSLIQSEFNPPAATKNEVKYGNTIFREGDPILIIESTPDVLSREDYERIVLLRKPKDQLSETELSLTENLPDFETHNREMRGDKLFNGELGKIVEIDTENSTLYVEVNGRQYAWLKKNLKYSTLGYAMTIHKMQGSSNRAIIFVADKSNTYMLNRQLVYTGITRARERLVIIGTGYTINGSVKRDGAINRKTLLGKLIKAQTKSKNKNQGDT